MIVKALMIMVITFALFMNRDVELNTMALFGIIVLITAKIKEIRVKMNLMVFILCEL